MYVCTIVIFYKPLGQDRSFTSTGNTIEASYNSVDTQDIAEWMFGIPNLTEDQIDKIGKYGYEGDINLLKEICAELSAGFVVFYNEVNQ